MWYFADVKGRWFFMTANMDAMLWKTNKEWYRINEEKDCYELTETAPEEAKESFEIYKKLNNK